MVDPAAVRLFAHFYSAGRSHHLRATLRVANTALEHARRNGTTRITSLIAEQAIAEELE